MSNFLRTLDKSKNIEAAKNILINIGMVDFDFSSYAHTDFGVSVYFSWNGKKVRVSDHSVSNSIRMQDEIHFSFDVNTIGIGGVMRLKDNQKTNKLMAEKIYNIN